MTFDRVAIVEASLDTYLAQASAAAAKLPGDAPLREGSGLTARKAMELFEDQLLSRQLDVAARELKKTNRSFYTIGSAGHENNVVIGAQLRISDPSFLHYRSGALMMARARQLPGSTPAFDALLGIVASRDDPIAQGRHKVWGSRPLWVPPQTSTIASHLPKAMGLAFSLARARRLGVATDLPDDALVLCSFGDASVNHATALAAINTARYAVRLGLPMPILFVCEDNETGISVPTPEGWIASTFGHLEHLRYDMPRARSTRCGMPSPRPCISCGARAVPRSCICAPYGCGAMPAATPSSRIGPPRRLPRTSHATRCCATRGTWSRRERPLPRSFGRWWPTPASG